MGVIRVKASRRARAHTRNYDHFPGAKYPKGLVKASKRGSALATIRKNAIRRERSLRRDDKGKNGLQRPTSVYRSINSGNVRLNVTGRAKQTLRKKLAATKKFKKRFRR